MKIYVQAGMFLLSSLLVFNTQAKEISYSPANEKYSFFMSTIPGNIPDEKQAKIAQLRSEIVTMLINELGVNKEETEQIISVAKYLTPSGRDINKVGVVNAKLRELQQLESTHTSN